MSKENAFDLIYWYREEILKKVEDISSKHKEHSAIWSQTLISAVEELNDKFSRTSIEPKYYNSEIYIYNDPYSVLFCFIPLWDRKVWYFDLIYADSGKFCLTEPSINKQECIKPLLKPKTFSEKRAQRDKKKYPDLTQEQILEDSPKVELFSKLMHAVWDTRDRMLAEKEQQPFAYSSLAPVYVIPSTTVSNEFEKFQRNIENILKEA